MPPTTVPVGLTPRAQAATEDKTLGRVHDPRTPKDTPKDINITVSKLLWLGVSGLPVITKGKLLQWQKRSPTCLLARMHARTHARMHAYETPCTRCSPTGSSETSPLGEALDLRGAARVHAQAARLRRAHRRGRLARPHRLSSRPRARDAPSELETPSPRPREPTSSPATPPYPAASLRE
jgi:hypothetical protein